MKILSATVVGFFAALFMGVLQSACVVASCDCPPDPDSPQEQALELTGAVRWTDDGNTAERPLEATSGTIVTEGESLLIRYVTPDGEYTASYHLQEGYDY